VVSGALRWCEAGTILRLRSHGDQEHVQRKLFLRFGVGLVDVYAASIPDLPFKPGVHVNYGETRLRMRDGLPKMRDMPAEMGGSGITVPEQ